MADENKRKKTGKRQLNLQAAMDSLRDTKTPMKKQDQKIQSKIKTLKLLVDKVKNQPKVEKLKKEKTPDV